MHADEELDAKPEQQHQERDGQAGYQQHTVVCSEGALKYGRIQEQVSA